MKFNPGEICSYDVDFQQLMIEQYHWLKHQNHVFSRYLHGLESLGYHTKSDFLNEHSIPLLPIEAFRDTSVYALGDRSPDLIFRSSGTTTSVRSKHQVAFKEQYMEAIFRGLRFFYPLDEYVVLGYTPGYSQNPESSLIWMIDQMIRREGSGLSGFLELNRPVDVDRLKQIEMSRKKVMLFGAAFGLIDIIEKYPCKLPADSVVIETGGMKTYRREMTRSQMHTYLARGFDLDDSQIHSEYGMTELLSQAYSQGDEWFKCPPWMKVSIRDPFNPLQALADGEEGLIGIIDLANWGSCPFILTGDKGVRRDDGAFQVNGRWSKYHLRGCNFLIGEDL